MNQDTTFMSRCIELANESYKTGDFPFGAIIVKDGETVAEAQNTVLRDITGHAEINAIKKALQYLSVKEMSECTLYTNFEPCAMCSFIIRDIGLKRVVFAIESPHWGGYSKWNILSDSTIDPDFIMGSNGKPPSVTSGVLRKEARELFDLLKWNMHQP